MSGQLSDYPVARVLNLHSVKWKILICFAIIFLLGAPAAQRTLAAEDKQVVTDPVLSVQHQKGDTLISIRMGMHKTEVDRLLGNPEAYLTPDGGQYFKYEDLYAAYIDDRLAWLSLGTESKLAQGVTFQMSQADALKILGETSVPNRFVYVYRWDSQAGKAVQLKGEKEIQLHQESPDVYSLSLSVNFNGEVSSIQIVRNDYTALSEKHLIEKNAISIPFRPVKLLNMKDLSFTPQGRQTYITLGMQREKAEEITGKPIDENLFGIVYDGITISYRNNQVVSMIIRLSDDSKTIYETPRGAGLLTSTALFKGLYGKPSSEKDPFVDYIFVMDEKKDRMHTMREFGTAAVNGHKPKYAISMITVEVKGQRYISYMMICDYQFAQNPI
ncbi:hypothetical protein [Paenibacillus sp. LPE1-1-1.1]|uniref:hypothetical protein n=1 Tax=Paenibacillus sp. LPE1-1-1.1 TaxID=3135230 RepID=UPI00342286E2